MGSSSLTGGGFQIEETYTAATQENFFVSKSVMRIYLNNSALRDKFDLLETNLMVEGVATDVKR